MHSEHVNGRCWADNCVQCKVNREIYIYFHIAAVKDLQAQLCGCCMQLEPYIGDIGCIPVYDFCTNGSGVTGLWKFRAGA